MAFNARLHAGSARRKRRCQSRRSAAQNSAAFDRTQSQRHQFRQCHPCAASRSQQDNYSQTPLHEACFRTHDNIVKALLDAGADVNAAGMQNYTPIQAAIRNRFARDTPSEDPSVASESHRRLYSIIELLLAADPDWRVCAILGNPILHFLAEFADVHTIRLFQGARLTGIDINSRTAHGETALQVLAKREDVAPGLFRNLANCVRLLGRVTHRTCWPPRAHKRWVRRCCRVTSTTQVKMCMKMQSSLLVH
ncbi:ankyrin [Trematosphaeria pertusa]|uniref:Ankyrin n=1 Tax=Trematosphaeria pertusa TaxID=390896 RepID=A0A6A6IL19_9PLEO|nr:ankyrin [Trematosphaeria pertusa]KAF2251121.1 ankyrin [Trematosphaeria pertusa]